MRLYKMESIRWAFNFGSWKPSKNEWMIASQCIQPEEKERIGRFYYTKDAKAAVGGRLLMRKMVSETLHIPYKDIEFARTEKNKPYLTNSVPNIFPNFNFNASHQGSYAVLAAEPILQVGIDVMKVEEPRGKSVADFFHTMRKQLTEDEWITIKERLSEHEQLVMFYRHWCLKESFIKAIGIGLGFDLLRLNFIIKTDDLAQNVITEDTRLCLDGKLSKTWRFQETMLDKDHCVAVAMGHITSIKDDGSYQDIYTSNSIRPMPNLEKENHSSNSAIFRILTYNELTSKCQFLNEPDEEYWNKFNSKPESPNS